MNVLHKTNQGKSMRKEGGYPGEVGHDKVRKMIFSEWLQNDSGSLLNKGTSRVTFL